MAHRKIYLAIIIYLGITISLTSVFAAPTEITYPEIAAGVIAPATTKTLLPIYVKYLFSTLVALSGIIAFGSGAYAGVRIAMSAGDPSAFSDAKDQLMAAGLGIAFTLGAVIILNTVDPQIVIIKPYNEIELGIMLDTDPNCAHITALANDPSSWEQQNPHIMRVTQSEPLLVSFDAHCMKFVSKTAGTLEARLYSIINYVLPIGTYNNDTDPGNTITNISPIPKSISFIWKIAGVYLMKATNEEKYVPQSTGVLGNDFNDSATKIRFRSTPPPDPIYFGAVLHENENWSGKCKVYVTQGSIDGDTNWVTMVPPTTPFALNTAPPITFGVSSVTTFNPTFQPTMTADGVTFYENDNFGGRVVGGPYRTFKRNLAGPDQDQATSIKIQGNYIAILFEHPNAEGLCEVFTKSDANLADNPIGRCYCGPFGWGCKDCLSSYIIIPTR